MPVPGGAVVAFWERWATKESARRGCPCQSCVGLRALLAEVIELILESAS
jgi:hypothetical protein